MTHYGACTYILYYIVMSWYMLKHHILMNTCQDNSFPVTRSHWCSEGLWLTKLELFSESIGEFLDESIANLRPCRYASKLDWYMCATQCMSSLFSHFFPCQQHFPLQPQPAFLQFSLLYDFILKSITLGC